MMPASSPLRLIQQPALRLTRDGERATRLWPDSPALQHEWLRAVAVVRSTRNGWLLERRQERVS